MGEGRVEGDGRLVKEARVGKEGGRVEGDG